MKVFLKLLSLLMTLAFIGGCSAKANFSSAKQYYASFIDVFDTITTITAISESAEEFHAMAENIHDELMFYHQLFDIYHSYEGINNLKTINDAAGKAPVEVDDALIALLMDCKSAHELTNGKVNIAMGSVLALWHTARSDAIARPEDAYLPEESKLRAAARHMDMNHLHIDPMAHTVYISDPDMRLDVGAIAKGWAVERVARHNSNPMVISVGGNVRSIGTRDEKGTGWKVGIENPDDGEYLQIVFLRDQSLVTSGDYQRFYDVDGRRYAHIIDPESLYPPRLWRSVSILCADSALADILSTALFLMPMDEGAELLNKCGASALWVNLEGDMFYSASFPVQIRY